MPDANQKLDVMPGLVPGIHVLGAAGRTWMAGTSPVMTVRMLEVLTTRYSDTPGGMSASVTPTSSMLVMMALRMKPRPLLKSIQVLT
ncbi:hypothetical protein M2427_007977 [Bradyrhizobium sp. BR13661]|jgi:hypothetical protein|nr:hypothetical protein [Bradyrhizobium sp. BR13661]